MTVARLAARTATTALVCGALAVGAAWAGSGLVPVPVTTDAGRATELLPVSPAAGAAAPAPAGRPAGLMAGAARVSIAPRPDLMATRFPGARWEKDLAKCATLSEAFLEQLPEGLEHAASTGSPWPENPDCIYQGGFGLGPMNAVKAFDTAFGLWVRAFAVSDGRDVLVTTVLDGEGWLWDYASKCDDCGAKDIAAALAAEPALRARGFRPESLVLHATHSHAAPDFIGGWGFVPDWYMAQVTDAIKTSVRQAVVRLQPAVVEAGEVEARAHNGERRDTYRAAEEQQLGWLRARDRRGRTIATLGTYAAHPTTTGTNGGVAHPDWPGVFERRLEQRFGGIGLHVMTGLGNMSASGGVLMGARLADLVPARGRPVTGDLRVARTTFRSALTNVPLTALGTPGFFDRQFDPLPVAVSTGENETAPCVSASAQSIELPVTVARIGSDVVITTGPGELFSNLTNTIKEKSPGRVVLPFAQTNDALGYMPQSFELNPVGQQGLGFVAGGAVFVNYEDSYAVDRCIGDLALETTLAAVAALK